MYGTNLKRHLLLPCLVSNGRFQEPRVSAETIGEPDAVPKKERGTLGLGDCKSRAGRMPGPGRDVHWSWAPGSA
eukprot:4952690-Pyramimonas_sp.AAC.1